MIGRTLGAYEVVAKLGAGGMGEVYRARDTRLNRDVAMKVLPPALAGDADRLARFSREAKVLAALNHSAIAHVYGFESFDGTNAIVMELVEGEDLSRRIARGAIAVAEALPMAAQIADALAAAHEQGVIHRDLKPANIKLRDDGTVKLLDFGLAKALDVVPGSRNGALNREAANSPTLTSPAMTAMGMILGTAAYMAPEQAKGKVVDRRADLWAFGCVVYEMLTGRRAFVGDDVSDVLAEVIKSDPDWSALPAHTPPAVALLLRRCLVKDPRQRLADASTARLEIEEAMRLPGPASSAAAPRGRSSWRERTAWGIAALMTGVAMVAGTLSFRRAQQEPGVVRTEAHLQIVTPDTVGDPQLSPDGRFLAFRGLTISIRPLNADTLTPLASAAVGSGLFGMFWSPDAKSIAFLAGQKLKRVDLATGAVQTLADAPTPRGGDWSPDGRTILFAPGGNGPVMRIPATGGPLEAVTELRPDDTSHRHPTFLLDGRHFLLWVLGPRGVRGEYLGSLDSRVIRHLFDADGPATFLPPEHVLFVREGVLYAQRLEPTRFALQGDPIPVESGFSQSPTAGPVMSAAAPGLIAYRREAVVTQQLTWFDRSGRRLGTIGEPLTDAGVGASLSPDGRTVAITRNVHGQPSIWLMDTGRGTLARFASEANRPVWSPKGDRLAFQSGMDGFGRVYWKSVGTDGPPELVFRSTEAQNMLDWSPDASHILYASQSPRNARDLWMIPVTGSDRTPVPFVQTQAEETGGACSPDGKWIAYVSDETGRFEVYVRAVSGPRRSIQVSKAGATAGGAAYAVLLWRGDSQELYYRAGGQTMAVSLSAKSDGRLDAGAPVPLFQFPGELIAAPDGQRFLVRAVLNDPGRPPVTVIVNWDPSARR